MKRRRERGRRDETHLPVLTSLGVGFQGCLSAGHHAALFQPGTDMTVLDCTTSQITVCFGFRVTVRVESKGGI